MTETTKELVIWGAAGHAKVLAEFVPALGYRVASVFDNDEKITASPIAGIPLFTGRPGFESWLSKWNGPTPYAAMAIGGACGAARLEIQQLFVRHDIPVPVLVHPRGYVAASALLGEGTQVLVNATVCADARVGQACIINTASSVDHECELADGVHIGPGARLAGCVAVGRCSFIGTGAIVLPRIRIGENAVVGAGAVVTRDVPDGAVVYGNPARAGKVLEDRRGT